MLIVLKTTQSSGRKIEVKSLLLDNAVSFQGLLTLSDLGFLDTLNTWGGQNLPAGKRWSLMASEATAEAKKRKNIVSDIFLYL